MNKKIIGLFSVAFLSFSNLAAAEYLIKFSNSQSKGIIPEKLEPSLFSSCKEILENGQSTGNGVYTINVNSKEFDVYCDMTSAGGGWTMVVAQFEQDSVGNWDEGIQVDYDPSLSANKGFALNSQEIPSHSQTAFGKDFDADNIDYFNYVYSSANDIPLERITGIGSGNDYYIHRDLSEVYSDHNAGEQTTFESTSWKYTLTVDQVGGVYYTWAFAPNHQTIGQRGYSYNGNNYANIENNFAWTVWVR